METTKKCPLCAKDIPEKAKKCPECQGDIRNWFVRHWIITTILVFGLIGAVVGEDKEHNKNVSDNMNSNDIVIPKMKVSIEKSSYTPKPTTNETMSQRNARRSATRYLQYMAFSETGLIKQLQFEKYSKEDAKYAISKISINWNEQAVKKAKSYLDNMAFSKDSLIKQLKFDGFTSQQAIYGANEAYK